MIRANMAEPLIRQIPRALGWTLDYLVSGALYRVLRASWEFGVALIHFQIMVLWWLALPIIGGWLTASVLFHDFEFSGAVAVLAGVFVASLIFAAFREFATRWFVIQINSHWPYLCEFARGEATCFDAPIAAGAQRLIEAAHANEVDEIVVVGHSGGGVLAPAAITRALELDPEVGRRGPPVVLLTLGSIAPGAALHPRATKLRDVFARLAVEPSITWIDSQSRKDVLNFWEFDPIGGLGIKLAAPQVNPILWRVRFRDMLSNDFYRRIRFNFFRLHYQFIMANDRRGPYDYFMLVAGPVPVATWAKEPFPVMQRFAVDGSLTGEQATAPVS
jgi:hypothetical protein